MYNSVSPVVTFFLMASLAFFETTEKLDKIFRNRDITDFVDFHRLHQILVSSYPPYLKIEYMVVLHSEKIHRVRATLQHKLDYDPIRNINFDIHYVHYHLALEYLVEVDKSFRLFCNRWELTVKIEKPHKEVRVGNVTYGLLDTSPFLKEYIECVFPDNSMRSVIYSGTIYFSAVDLILLMSWDKHKRTAETCLARARRAACPALKKSLRRVYYFS